MMFSKAFVAATLATLATALPQPAFVRRDNNTSSGTGSVTIVNSMDIPVYAWSVTDRVSEMQTLSAGGGSYTESWQHNSNGGGVSIKLSTTEDQSDVLQFEYTESGETIYWDMSCIDMNRVDSTFTKYGFSVAPSATGANCPSVSCGAGDSACAEAYLQPKDDHATHGCPVDTTFTLNLGA
ncbi:hypothetical protein P175DRAFT_0445869 [Aspergillus ochraceoroseus IBT 24754]|uniref:Extracellular thaumatin domain protein n=3 Tax=Aspergillus subgen. Nidulantes TaxID=2720870 RepID=A0A0F8WUF7_9EURO|nr:uncharacterized protein P175DRAFT_0445869 [Aspergillus ochraceoroseus IBT 24754]KKK20884.1 hypothetical protein AOCH_004571 [Aspergillus ochraceoroseus]KKK21215.1 hypothetical protein ARAM_003978 [Aspergillus rambellii]PTU17438.1 hypothetical protein P175DRAFT_0445869 [Aspergillus ochraceoroseus IBT 24754]